MYLLVGELCAREGAGTSLRASPSDAAALSPVSLCRLRGRSGGLSGGGLGRRRLSCRSLACRGLACRGLT